MATTSGDDPEPLATSPSWYYSYWKPHEKAARVDRLCKFWDPLPKDVKLARVGGYYAWLNSPSTSYFLALFPATHSAKFREDQPGFGEGPTEDGYWNESAYNKLELLTGTKLDLGSREAWVFDVDQKGNVTHVVTDCGSLLALKRHDCSPW
eukprot:TRINITY_DN16294_c0_g1_i1.p1 TRINITY_DN16294_c0_g1~~TRINITY_DN16294_c0_g1_i1.p1  ORF type:complete len:151 (-),score=6.12 TRINITY_DN16294_c0_g1_i1:146-598(-)